MKWMLVYIIVGGTDPVAVNALGPNGEVFDSMTECFFAREQLSITVGGSDGYFPINSQAVCISTDKY